MTLDGVQWQAIPYHPIRRAGALLGCSQAQIYNLLHAGDLAAVKMAGRTLVSTESLLATLAKAKPWSPDPGRAERISAMRKKRPSVASRGG